MVSISAAGFFTSPFAWSTRVTIVPCSRGGRLVVASTAVAALARPTWPASTPRSERLHSSTGFFLAAMIPLKEG